MKLLSIPIGTKVRFLLVGSFNTLLDFSLLYILTFFIGLNSIPANITSTTVAFIGSFFLNRNYTFKTTSLHAGRQFILFTVVTLFSLWIIQTIVISLLSPLLIDLDDSLSLLVAKIFATVVSLIWNYTLYSRVVFRTPTNSSD